MDWDALIDRVDAIIAELPTEEGKEDFRNLKSRIVDIRTQLGRFRCPPIIVDPDPGECRKNIFSLNTLDEMNEEIEWWIDRKLERWSG